MHIQIHTNIVKTFQPLIPVVIDPIMGEGRGTALFLPTVLLLTCLKEQTKVALGEHPTPATLSSTVFTVRESLPVPGMDHERN